MCESIVKDPSRCLGSGAKGSVFLGYDQDSGRFVAIKELHGVFDGGDQQEAQRIAADIANEINLMKKAQHENLVAYVGAKRVENIVQIVMEYVSGGSIAGVIKRHKRLREPVARSYIKDILSGLAYLHTVCHACHRDVKPENVLITPEGRCKLADFGASRTIETTKVLKTCIGTPSFMAPEVIAGEGYSYCADIWSVGATLFTMLSGAAPYAHVNNAMAIMFKIASSPAPPSLPDDVHVSSELQQFLALCFTRDAAQRPSAADLLSHAWLRSAGDATFHMPSAPNANGSSMGSSVGLLATQASLVEPTAARESENMLGNGNAANAASEGDPFSSITGATGGETFLRKCHYCREQLALFTCDQCRLIGPQMPHNLCPGCWPTVHSHHRSAPHRKMPLLVVSSGAAGAGGAYGSPSPHSSPSASFARPPSGVAPGGDRALFASPSMSQSGGGQRIQHDDPGGLLYANGQFAEMYVGEQSEWQCGKCTYINDGPLGACEMCGHLR